MMNGFKRTAMVGLVMTFGFLSGCTAVYKGMGNTLISYSEDELIPYLLSTDDAVMACASGESLTPLLLSFGNVTQSPDNISVLVHMVAGLCEEQRALEDELRYMRALQQNNVMEAQDARIAQKRHHALAAARQFKAYQALVRYLGDPNEACPHFRSDEDEMIWLMGSAVGVLAALNDSQSDSSAGVPKNIAAKAERAARCVDNEKWWGMPMSIRAALWTVVPGLLPNGENPWVRLEDGQILGHQSGVRMAHALHAIAASNAGDEERKRGAIRAHAKSIDEITSNPQYRIFDIVATKMTEALSDRMWTEATGVRTPIGGLGTFWDDKTESSEIDFDIDDLL